VNVGFEEVGNGNTLAAETAAFEEVIEVARIDEFYTVEWIYLN